MCKLALKQRLSVLGEADDQVVIVRGGVIQGGLVAAHLTTLQASVQDDPAFFGVVFDTHRFHVALAGIGPVSRLDVHMKAVQAAWTVVAHAAILQGRHFEATVGTGEALIGALDCKFTSHGQQTVLSGVGPAQVREPPQHP